MVVPTNFMPRFLNLRIYSHERPAWKTFENQHLEQLAVIMHRHSPFRVVIGNILGIAQIAPVATWFGIGYIFCHIHHSLSFFLFPNGPLKCPRFSFTPYLFNIRKTELRLRKPLTVQMSSMA